MNDDQFVCLELLAYDDHEDTRELYCTEGADYCTVRDLEGQYQARRLGAQVELATVVALLNNGYLATARYYTIPARPAAQHPVYRLTPAGRAAYSRERDARWAHHAMTGE